MAHQHCQRYVQNVFRFGYIVIWQYWNTFKYQIWVHFEQSTCNNACFVILGHYGCPRGFLPKSLPVIVHWANKCFETIMMVKYTGETCCPCPFPSFTMIFVIPTTLSQDRKLTHDKTLPLGFTKKMEQLNIAFKIWCSVDIFETKYNKNNVVE